MARTGVRVLSHSEIETALTCLARWDFSYGGRLAGSTLKSKATAPVLSGGRAWGAAVAAYHAGASRLTAAWDAHLALIQSLDADELEMLERDFVPDPQERVELQARLAEMLDHYVAILESEVDKPPVIGGPLPSLDRLEGEAIAGIPSRGGKRASNRYRFQALIDGMTYIDGLPWIVEFKLRGQLTPVEFITMSRQIRRYAWAYRQIVGITPVGVLVEEKLNEVPKPAKINKGDKVSHAKDQITTPEVYAEACRERGVEVNAETFDHLAKRRWYQRTPVMFRDGELDEAGQELVSAAKLIRDLDNGELYPIRNTVKMLCQGCRFRPICPTPEDDLLLESLYVRTVPKRLREPREGKEVVK